MNARSKLALLLTVSFLLYVTVLTLVNAQERTVGVMIGDSFKYGYFTANYGSNDPYYETHTLPIGALKVMQDYNETEWKLISVRNITSYGDLISLQEVQHFKNGTEITFDESVDLYYGTVSGPVTYSVIAANLTVGDEIYESTHYMGQRITQTLNRTYGDVVRQTNFMNFTRLHSNIIRIMDSYNVTGTYDAIINSYWDRASGILVEFSINNIEQVENYTTAWSWSYRLMESNVWTVPEYSTLPLILLISVTLAITMITYKRECCGQVPKNHLDS